MTRQVWCDCLQCRVDADRCDGCDWGDDFDDGDAYSDPPLYPPGKLAGMSVDELRRELDRQSDRQGRLGDAEYIDDRAVEECERRYRVVEGELRSRGVRP